MYHKALLVLLLMRHCELQEMEEPQAGKNLILSHIYLKIKTEAYSASREPGGPH